jgi:ornithine carbamoyltransferase
LEGNVTILTTDLLPALAGRDFLDIADLSVDEVRGLLALAAEIKAGRWRARPLEGRHLALIFQKPSMRTRVSFEVAIGRLGATPITLSDVEIGLGRREQVSDVGHVLARFTSGIVARLFKHTDLLELAAASDKPVVNALTDRSHPCQVLADLLTLQEALGGLEGRRVAFVGDGNNVASSLIEAAALTGLSLVVITPPSHYPDPDVIERARRLAPGGRLDVKVTSDLEALQGVDAVYTDVWTSMGQESESEARRREFVEYQVDEDLMARAPRAIFMHCLPAHRGEEVTAAVIDGPRSVVFDQAENRLYAQMALLASIFGAPG